ncbi:hypothetical protein MMC25_008227 [Agyrium rufum]|nr:hypothetical protein [Agyrium rufum]
MPLLPVSATFSSRKAAILSSLAVPGAEYTDASPKGSVDEGIRDLIDEINALEGIVTTSSCGGRVSVFLEGRKGPASSSQGSNEVGGDVDEEDDQDGSKQLVTVKSRMEGKQTANPGGKGRGGRWLFVSHDPVPLPEDTEDLSAMLGLKDVTTAFQSEPARSSLTERELCMAFDPHRSRLVKIQFEPMILHILTASLHHAQPILSAAINAGFRESGVQSLKNLDDGNAFPMVALRSSGLGLAGVVGFVDDADDSESGENGTEERESVQMLVPSSYLSIMLQVANERFKANAERIVRLRQELARIRKNRQATKGGRVVRDEERETMWEDVNVRRERLMREGLERKEKLKIEREKDANVKMTNVTGPANEILNSKGHENGDYENESQAQPLGNMLDGLSNQIFE